MAMLCDTPRANCWAEIDTAALARNAYRLSSGPAELMAVVKADGYGHGAEIVASTLVRCNVRHFGVATAQEGFRLRCAIGPAPNIYVMTASPPADAEAIVLAGLIPFVSSATFLAQLGREAHSRSKTADVHLEVDTGIGRAGLQPSEFDEALRLARDTAGVRLTGICTHFTWGENAADARGQHALFERVLRSVPDAVRRGLSVHAANSPAALALPGAHYELIRPGLLLYGIAPTGGDLPTAPNGEALEPVLSLFARVLLVRHLPAGADISYGRTYTLAHSARVATIGAGYGDGYPRRLSNIGKILLPGGIEAPIRGRVCMDQVCVELPENAAVREGDTATLIGRSGARELRAADIAQSIDATPHEIVTSLTGRVPRLIAGAAP